MNFDESPLLVIWEVTQACDLACVHCRASAQPGRDPFELTTEQGFRLLDQVKAFGNPLMVFTGGDPLKRPDLFEMMRYSVKLGLRTNVSPSATPLLTNEVIDEFKRIGIARMAISLDGSNVKTHDEFRAVPGTFERAMEALRHAKEIGLDVQYQTTVTKWNIDELDDIAQIGVDMGVKMWSLFFLIVTGRAAADDDLSGEDYERVFDKIYRISKTAPFEVKTTEAMHYRRFVAQKKKEEMRNGTYSDHEEGHRAAFRTAGVSDGKGFVFVSHQGEVYPSGFLPLSGGNVTRESLVDIYRNRGLFKVLRDTTLREGKCGVCEYHKICGGSRSRAFALTGNFLAEDPRCTYQPELCAAG
jgi:radical SAM protein